MRCFSPYSCLLHQVPVALLDRRAEVLSLWHLPLGTNAEASEGPTYGRAHFVSKARRRKCLSRHLLRSAGRTITTRLTPRCIVSLANSSAYRSDRLTSCSFAFRIKRHIRPPVNFRTKPIIAFGCTSIGSMNTRARLYPQSDTICRFWRFRYIGGQYARYSLEKVGGRTSAFRFLSSKFPQT